MLTYLYSLGLQCFDNYGERLVSGAIFSYDLGTTSNKITYQDVYGLVPNTNPIILDHAGRASVYLNGSYTLRLVDKNGVDIETIDVRGSSQDSLSTSATGTWAMNEVVVVENYAAVRAINSPYAWIFVQGREHNADGGTGIFNLDIGSTESDDDGIILQPNTTGRYIRYNVQKVDGRWFGLTYDTIVSQSVYLSAACESSLRFAKPVYINGSIYLNSNFSTSAQVEFSDISSLVSTLPITANFYSETIGAKDCFGISVQPKFYANDEVRYSWMNSENVEGKVQKLLACTSEECLINFDEDIETTESIIIPSNFTFKSNKQIYFNTTNPINLTIPNIDKLYSNTIKFKQFSTVGVITIPFEINPEFFCAVGDGLVDDSTPMQASVYSGNILITGNYKASSPLSTPNSISIRSENINKNTMPSLILNSIAFSSLALKNIAIISILNGTLLNANNVKMSCDGTCNTVILNDVEYISGKMITEDAQLNDVVYNGSTVPCSKISRLLNSQFSTIYMAGQEKIEGIIENVIITPSFGNSIIIKDSIVQNLIYSDTSTSFKPILVLSGSNIISNSSFTSTNYKQLCKGYSSSAVFNSCYFSDNLTISEASNKYTLNNCIGGTLEVNGFRNNIKYDTLGLSTSACLTSSTTKWGSGKHGGVADTIDVSVIGSYFRFNQAYYMDWVYNGASAINNDPLDNTPNYVYNYIPDFNDSVFDKFIRFGGRIRVTTKNPGNSYFKVCVMSPDFRFSKDGTTVGLTTSASSMWKGPFNKLLAETGVIAISDSGYITTEYSYQINQNCFRPIIYPFGFAVYPILLTDHLERRADLLNTSATTQYYTNAELCFVGYIDANTEIRVDIIPEIPKNDFVSETYFKSTSSMPDTYYIAEESYLGNTYYSSGVNGLSDKWITNVKYSTFGNKYIMEGVSPTIITSANNTSGIVYVLCRNGYFDFLDGWKWILNPYSNRPDLTLSNTVENNIEIIMNLTTDNTVNTSATPVKMIKPYNQSRFYKVSENMI